MKEEREGGREKGRERGRKGRMNGRRKGRWKGGSDKSRRGEIEGRQGRRREEEEIEKVPLKIHMYVYL